MLKHPSLQKFPVSTCQMYQLARVNLDYKMFWMLALPGKMFIKAYFVINDFSYIVLFKKIFLPHMEVFFSFEPPTPDTSKFRVTPKRRPCRLQTVQTVQTVQTEYFFSYSSFCIYFWLASAVAYFWLWSQISVQLYFGVLAGYAQAALARYGTVDAL